VQRRPFEDKRLGATAHAPFDDFEGVDVDFDFLALLDRVKMWRRVVAVKHPNYDSIESAEFGHEKSKQGASGLSSEFARGEFARGKLKHGCADFFFRIVLAKVLVGA
jgi:hypothetical protein